MSSADIADPFDSLGLSIYQRLARTHGGARAGQVLMVTSARRREGKSFVARRLSQRFLGLVDGPVLLVDANATGRAPGATSIPTLGDGFFGCVAAGEVVPESIRATAIPSLSVMPCTMPASSSMLFQMNGLRRVLRDLREQFALTILDAGTLADSGCLPQLADGSVLVVDSRHTRRDVVRGALESPHIDRDRVLGVVLNKRPQYVPGWLYRMML